MKESEMRKILLLATAFLLGATATATAGKPISDWLFSKPMYVIEGHNMRCIVSDTERKPFALSAACVRLDPFLLPGSPGDDDPFEIVAVE